jgi:hypothetical protein
MQCVFEVVRVCDVPLSQVLTHVSDKFGSSKPVFQALASRYQDDDESDSSSRSAASSDSESSPPTAAPPTRAKRPTPPTAARTPAVPTPAVPPSVPAASATATAAAATAAAATAAAATAAAATAAAATAAAVKQAPAATAAAEEGEAGEAAAKSTSNQLLWEDVRQKWEALTSTRRTIVSHTKLAQRLGDLPVLAPLLQTSPANSSSTVTAVRWVGGGRWAVD